MTMKAMKITADSYELYASFARVPANDIMLFKHLEDIEGSYLIHNDTSESEIDGWSCLFNRYDIQAGWFIEKNFDLQDHIGPYWKILVPKTPTS